MSRPLGGYIGYDAEPATTAAPGIWTLREAEFYKRKEQWPPLFRPDFLTGLQLWLDASDDQTLYDATTGGSLVAADGGVARWEDKSGNNYHMTQGTAGRRPARKTAIQGGLDVLRFDDSDDVLAISDSDMVADVGGATVIAAVIYSADGAVFNASVNGITSARVFLDFTNSTDLRAGGRRLDADSFVGHSVSRASGAQVVAGVFDYTNQELAAAVDGSKSVYGSTFHSGGNTSATNSFRVTVGGIINVAGDAVSSGFGGDICELLVYTQALSDTDREAVENYLLAKWGIS